MPIEVRTGDPIAAAFERFQSHRVGIVIVLSDSRFLYERGQIATSALEAGLPTLFGFPEHVEDGGLISYGRSVPKRSPHCVLGGQNTARRKAFRSAHRVPEQARTGHQHQNGPRARAHDLTHPPRPRRRGDRVKRRAFLGPRSSPKPTR